MGSERLNCLPDNVGWDLRQNKVKIYKSIGLFLHDSKNLNFVLTDNAALALNLTGSGVNSILQWHMECSLSPERDFPLYILRFTFCSEWHCRT